MALVTITTRFTPHCTSHHVVTIYVTFTFMDLHAFRLRCYYHAPHHTTTFTPHVVTLFTYASRHYTTHACHSPHVYTTTDLPPALRTFVSAMPRAVPFTYHCCLPFAFAVFVLPVPFTIFTTTDYVTVVHHTFRSVAVAAFLAFSCLPHFTYRGLPTTLRRDYPSPDIPQISRCCCSYSLPEICLRFLPLLPLW